MTLPKTLVLYAQVAAEVFAEIGLQTMPPRLACRMT